MQKALIFARTTIIMPIRKIAIISAGIRRKIRGTLSEKPVDAEKIRELYSNIVFSVIKGRRSTRKYMDCDVPDGLLPREASSLTSSLS
jgi:hypothetical protein